MQGTAGGLPPACALDKSLGEQGFLQAGVFACALGDTILQGGGGSFLTLRFRGG